MDRYSFRVLVGITGSLRSSALVVESLHIAFSNITRFMQQIFISTSMNIGRRITINKLLYLYSWITISDTTKSYRICFQNISLQLSNIKYISINKSWLPWSKILWCIVQKLSTQSI